MHGWMDRMMILLYLPTGQTLHTEFSHASFVAEVLLVDSVFVPSVCLVYHVEHFYEIDIYIWSPLVPGKGYPAV